MTMAETVFPASMRAIPTSSEIVGARRVTGSQWTTVRRVQTQWPSENRFSVAVRALVDTTEVDPTTQGELRFVATDVNGVTGVGAPVTIGGPGWVETKWLEVKGQGVPVARVSIDVQMRITSGTGGLTAERVEPLFVSLPGSNVQPVLPLSIVDYSTQWGTFPAAVANPIQGSGNSLLFIAVAPGPGFDSLHNGGALQWVDPPGADVIADFEVAPDSSAQFVQRVRMWHMFSESGAATYTFGFDCAQTSGSTPATDTQSLAIIGFDGQASTIRVAGPNVDVSDPMPYPAVSSAVDDLILAVATSQNDDRMTGSPTGSSGVGAWTEEFDLSATGANVRRLLGVWSARSQSSAVDPGEHDFTGTVAAHAMFTVIVPTGSGGSPVTYSPVAPSLLSYDIRPADVSTWGANRGNLQLINAGPGWNPGQTGVGFTSSWGTGYDLTWNGAGDEISSWAMDDGESRRLWRTTHLGRPVLRGGSQWRNDGSYDPVNNISGRNTATTYPGIDRIFYDGTRILHFSDIDSYIRVGPGADPVLWWYCFPTEEWMGARSNTTYPFDLHEPGAGLTSPFLSFVREGQFRLFSRDGQTADGGVPKPPATSNNDLGTTQLVQDDLAPLGQWNCYLLDFKLDPSSSDRWVRVYKVDPSTGAVSTILDTTAKIGYWYNNDSVLSGRFYLLNQMYAFHEFTDSADAAIGVVNNWDMDTSRVGPNPTVRYVSLLRAAGKASPGFTASDAINDIRHFLGLSSAAPSPEPLTGAPANQAANSISDALNITGTVASDGSGGPVEWVYSTDGGSTWTVFTNSGQVRKLAFTEHTFETFAAPLDPAEWTTYNGPGHAGNGLRDPAQVEVTGNNLVITGSEDAVDGVRAGGVAMLAQHRQTYGRWRVRFRADADPTLTFAALALLWSRENTSGPVPGGEIDFAEMTSPFADDRDPVKAFVHGNTDGVNDIVTETVYPAPIVGTTAFEYTVEWSPGRVQFYHTGGGIFVGSVLDSPTTPLPKWPLHLALQLDAFAASYVGGDVQAVYEYAGVSSLARSILVKARLQNNTAVETPTATITFPGIDEQPEFTTDLPATLPRPSGDLEFTVAWDAEADWQVQERPNSSSAWADSTGTGSSGTGTNLTFGTGVTPTNGRQYRVVLTNSFGDHWISTTTTVSTA